MSMSKNQIVMAAIGGVTLVAAAALGYLAFDAYSSKSEAVEERDGAAETVKRLLRAEVSPDKESELAYKKNADTLAGWTEAALATAAAGDRAVRDDLNPAAFKKKIVDEARVLAELEGEVEGKVVKAGFNFGLPDFVTGDKLPEKEKLPQLQRQWADIRTMVETLQACGIVELVRIEPTLVKQPTVAEQQPKETKKKKRKKKADEDAKPAYTEERYAIDFRAKPAALVKVVNALATSQRFIVVESLDFTRESDMIGKALGEGDKRGADAEQQSSRPRRRRRGAEQAEFGADAAATDAAAEADKGVVNDPDKEEPFLAKAVVLTYDFGSAAQASGGETAGAEDAKENKEEEE